MKIEKSKQKLNMESKRVYFLIYSVLFIPMAICVFWPYIENNKSFIWVLDGWNQHFRALMYYRQWLRTIAENFFVKHVFEIPTYTFSLGYGGDILTTFNYYAIGDPLTVFVGLVPERHMLFFYNALIILRMYLAGMAFSAFALYNKKKNFVALLAGTFVYVFSGYAIFVVRHPFFLNAMIYLPFVLLGVEMVIREKKTWLMTLSVFISLISNFYFFYMIVCFTVLYVLVRLGIMVGEKKGKEACQALLRISIQSFLGVLLGSFLFIPTVIAFLGDKRRVLKPYVPMFYSLEDYKGIIRGFVGFNYSEIYCILSFSAIIVLMFYVLYRSTKGTESLQLKILFPTLSLGLVFPYIGYALNGFSYVTCRFLFGYVMLVAYIIVFVWETFLALGKRVMFECLLVLVAYVVLCMTLGIWINDNMYSSLLYAALVLGLFAVLTMKQLTASDKDKRIIKNSIVFCVVVGCVLLNSAQCNSAKGFSYHNSFVKNDVVYDKFYGDESYIVREIQDDSPFYRYTGDDVTWNATIGNGTSSTQFFWSLSNPYVNEFLLSVGNLDNTAMWRYESLDDRTVLTTLAGVKYYVEKAGKKSSTSPFGYETIKATDKYSIYQNENNLPFGYGYSHYILRNDYEKLSSPDREAVMMKAVVVDEPVEGLQPILYQSDLQELPFEFVPNDNVWTDGKKIVVAEAGASLKINVEGIKNAETYFCINGLEYFYNADLEDGKENPEREDVAVHISGFCNEENRISKKYLNIKTPYSRYCTGKTDFVVNLNYTENAMQQIELYFPYAGEYYFEEIHIIGNNLKSYINDVTERMQFEMGELDLHNHNLAYGTNKVTGKIDVPEKGIFLMNIPYGKGWKAYVDGNAVKISCANIMFSGIEVGKGEHEIVLKYVTPGLVIGNIISGITAAVLFISLFKRKTNGKRI